MHGSQIHHVTRSTMSGKTKKVKEKHSKLFTIQMATQSSISKLDKMPVALSLIAFTLRTMISLTMETHHHRFHTRVVIFIVQIVMASTSSGTITITLSISQLFIIMALSSTSKQGLTISTTTLIQMLPSI